MSDSRHHSVADPVFNMSSTEAAAAKTAKVGPLPNMSCTDDSAATTANVGLTPSFYRDVLTFRDTRITRIRTSRGVWAISLVLDAPGALGRLVSVLNTLAPPLVSLDDLAWRTVYEASLFVVLRDESESYEQEVKMRLFLDLGWDEADTANLLTHSTRSLCPDNTTISVPALFWSDGAEFLEAAYNIARAVWGLTTWENEDTHMDIERIHTQICHHTRTLRAKLQSVGVQVGMLS